jgi:hypothetical protein
MAHADFVDLGPNLAAMGWQIAVPSPSREPKRRAALTRIDCLAEPK